MTTRIFAALLGASLLIVVPAAAAESVADRVDALEPIRTRAGFPRFVGDVLDEPGAGSALLDRLLRRDDPSDVRVALAEALGRSADAPFTGMARLAVDDGDTAVRAMLVRALRAAPSDVARPALDAALRSRVVMLRRAGAHELYWRADRSRFAALVAMALDDQDAAVRRDAVRAVGVDGVLAAGHDLRAALADANSGVRLAAFRALERQRPELLVPALLEQLGEDADARVAAAARAHRQ